MGSGEAGATLESPERKRGNARIRKEREGERKGGEGQMSLIPVLINAGSLLTPVLLSSSLALSFVNGVAEDARVHPWMGVERGQKGPKSSKCSLCF